MPACFLQTGTGAQLTETYGHHRSKYDQSQIIINYNNHYYTDWLESLS